MIGHALVAALGYIILAVAGVKQAGPVIRYFGLYLAASGFFSAITIIITWTLNNQKTDFGKGTGLSMLNYIGQLGPLVGTHLYPDSDSPFYISGMSICACFMVIVAVLALISRAHLKRKNPKEVNMDSLAMSNNQEGLVDGEKRKTEFQYIL